MIPLQYGIDMNLIIGAGRQARTRPDRRRGAAGRRWNELPTDIESAAERRGETGRSGRLAAGVAEAPA